MPKMIVRYFPDGKVKIEMEGFSGGKCLAASKRVEDALGGVKNRTETEDMHKEQEAKVDLYA